MPRCTEPVGSSIKGSLRYGLVQEQKKPIRLMTDRPVGNEIFPEDSGTAPGDIKQHLLVRPFFYTALKNKNFLCGDSLPDKIIGGTL